MLHLHIDGVEDVRAVEGDPGEAVGGLFVEEGFGHLRGSAQGRGKSAPLGLRYLQSGFMMALFSFDFSARSMSALILAVSSFVPSEPAFMPSLRQRRRVARWSISTVPDARSVRQRRTACLPSWETPELSMR